MNKQKELCNICNNYFWDEEMVDLICKECNKKKESVRPGDQIETPSKK